MRAWLPFWALDMYTAHFADRETNLLTADFGALERTEEHLSYRVGRYRNPAIIEDNDGGNQRVVPQVAV
jgi:hypothetical protein